MRRAELQAICQAEKENRASNKRKQPDDGLQKAEISNDECAVCFGTYDEDVIDGELRREWIQYNAQILTVKNGCTVSVWLLLTARCTYVMCARTLLADDLHCSAVSLQCKYSYLVQNFCVNTHILYKTYYYSTHCYYIISVKKLCVQKHVCLMSCC